MDDQTVLATIRPTPARRWIAIAMLFVLGAMLLYLAFAFPPADLGWQAFLIAVGAGALWLGEKMRRATERGVELTPAGLRDTRGETLCSFDEIRGIDRGLFAFKPSNGFVLRLADRGPARWEPGLWWRVGRRIGIGGVTPSTEGKFMAEMIAQRLAARDGEAR